MCFRRELRSLHSLPSLLCKLAVYAAVELLKQASVSLTLETARGRNLVSTQYYLFSKIAIHLICGQDGRFRVLENSKLILIKYVSRHPP